MANVVGVHFVKAWLLSGERDMILPIWASLLGLLGGAVLLPDHIDPTTRSALDSRSYLIGSVGEAYNEHYFVLSP